MTKELAIRIIAGDVLGTTEQTKEAVIMAVRALSQQNVPDGNVGDMISRQAAIDALGDIHPLDYNAQAYKARLEKLPSAQPERKTGRWIVKTVNTFEMAYGSTGYEPVYECSLCGGVEESYLRFDEPIMPEDANFPNYCPHCGAKMEAENG